MSWNCTLKYNSIAPLVWGKETVPQLCAFSRVETQLQPDSSEEYWLGTWHRQGQHSQPDPEERHRGRTRTSNLTSPGNTQECGDFTLNWGPLPFLLFNECPVPTEQAGFVVLFLPSLCLLFSPFFPSFPSILSHSSFERLSQRTEVDLANKFLNLTPQSRGCLGHLMAFPYLFLSMYTHSN